MIVGICLSVLASILFSLQYVFTAFLHPINGVEIFSWRMIIACPILAILIYLNRNFELFNEIIHRLRRNKLLIVGVILSSSLIGIQQWLFLWGPINGRGLQVSIGYFLLPLVMVLVGRVLYKEKLTILQKISTAFAFVGVAHELWVAHAFSWEALVVAFGFPCYFVLRRALKTDNTGGFLMDMVLMMPVCLYIAYDSTSVVHSNQLELKLLSLSAISALAFYCYIVASKLLPLGLFGLLGNVEPVLLLLVSLFLGEKIENHQLLTFIPIWLSVFTLSIEGTRSLFKHKFIARTIKELKL